MISRISTLLSFRLPNRLTRISFGPSWLFVIPVGIWAIITIYVPIMGNLTTKTGPWIVALLIAVMAAISLSAHLLTHFIIGRMTGHPSPGKLDLLIFGDASQSWSAGVDSWKDIAAAFSAPLVNLVLAGAAYLAWNAQFSPYLNLSTFFIFFFNLWLAVVNLVPAFPFDGGRVFRGLIFNWLHRPAAANQTTQILGYLIAAFQFGWGIYLIALQDQYSWETGLITLFCTLIYLLGLVLPKAWEWKQPDTAAAAQYQQSLALKIPALILITVILMAVPSNSLLTNYGIEAPGVALSVEPMVTVPSQYQHHIAGTFILTSVLAQTPIPLAGWVTGKLAPTIALIQPQKIQPNQPTPQETAQQGFQMLDESEITAEVVGLSLAGYPAQMVGQGASVVSVLANSPSKGILLPGDIITGVGDKPVQTASDLANLIEAQRGNETVSLQVKRNGNNLQISTKLIPPTTPSGSPKLGITVQTAGFQYKLPFSVQIIPQKIVGGPSAGLMFTLTLYNKLTSNDLTGGYRIAGTGTINPDGSVGPIGGVKQKVAAAEAAGAVYFLSPVEDYANAVSVANHIKVVKVATAEQAIQFLESLPPK